ncbi:PQQ-dependent sugar dehydrogenase [Marinihelvus fidelis]|uniref:PQQ-dependent sugar dehydrogenase n=1 Tax=Marinihelvus fidelis TaxID=2613842 RepID=A0A5N0TE50_9GAMM|nr:PQQ-dependent sugar dehydrogenase [Marinihelvus fidelis]KAA9132734.1 PQQ-dependent sugar dehydrogenase [Marinihelvus fidelis]
MRRSLLIAMIPLAMAAAGCSSPTATAVETGALVSSEGAAGDPAFRVSVVADFDQPWAMAFLPDGRLLVTEKPGAMKVLRWDDAGAAPVTLPVTGVPEVDLGGQGGLGDVMPHSDFADNGWVYFSYAEAGQGDTRGAVVQRGKLDCGAEACSLTDIEDIWRQSPKVSGRGHYSHRIVFGPQGYLWIASGDRQKMDPAQELGNTLGTVVRLNDDGSVPADNPFVGQDGANPEIWSYGHRNILGMAFGPDGVLWDLEHGPAGGDELNAVVRGQNYGWPVVSDGSHYDGTPIPDHDSRDDFAAPAISWTPMIAPGNLVFYGGDLFPRWAGHAIASGLKSQGLVFIEANGTAATEVARYPLGARIRCVVEGPDGALWVLEDERGDSQGRLLRLGAG